MIAMPAARMLLLFIVLFPFWAEPFPPAVRLYFASPAARICPSKSRTQKSGST
jgi:hypothetical protein